VKCVTLSLACLLVVLLPGSPKGQPAMRAGYAKERIAAPTEPLPVFPASGPLQTTVWGEGCLYNYQCPADTSAHGTCLHVPAGSGAIAMAQLMKYYGYPAHGTGEHGYTHPVYGIQYANFGATNYNWAAMPDSLVSVNDELSTLIYQCGIAQEMNFASQVSTSTPESLDSALHRYFSFPAGTWKNREDTLAAGWWEMIRGEIAASRPVILYGTDSLGTNARFFICDGFDGDGRFHINWGWGGIYNGYFSPDSLTPAGSNFNYRLQALMGLDPEPAGGDVVMDFEQVPDFSLTFGSWSAVDGDHYDTYGINGHTFPHQNDPMAFLSFNPAQVSPSMAGDPAIQPHNGQRFGACFSSNPPSNDDWFISPQVKIGNNGSFSFWIKSYNGLYGVDSYTVGISETEAVPGSFTVISGSQPLQTTTSWTKKTFNLSAWTGKKIYVAIHCLSNDRYLMMIDDLLIRPEAQALIAADFSADKSDIKSGDTVRFTDQSAGSPLQWHWKFPGGIPAESDGQIPPPVIYSSPGQYDVSLKVSNGAISDSIMRPGFIHVTGYASSVSLDFETSGDFSLDFNPWTVLDVKGGETYGIQGITFPHMFEPMSFICFNPAATTPAVTAMHAHTGAKLGCCFSTIPVNPPQPPKTPNDKWLISPKVSLGVNPVLEFWVMTYNSEFGDEKFFAEVSTSGTDTADFIPLTSSPDWAPVAWTRKTYDLSAFSGRDVHVAIRCVTDNGFIFMIDDISVTSSLAVGERPGGDGLLVFPNPASDRLTIKLPAGLGSQVRVELAALTGKILAEWPASNGENVLIVDLRNISAGTYVLKVSGDKAVFTRKITIIHP